MGRTRVPEEDVSTAWGWERCLSCVPAPHGNPRGASQGGLSPTR